LLRPIIH
ncbi:bacterial regulatory helix-turn-helix, lysR family protein, partial [Vibrio parahaemolyticus V-223/04]